VRHLNYPTRLVMLPQILLTAFLGAQLAAGAIIVQKDAQQDLSIAAPERWHYELCGKFRLQHCQDKVYTFSMLKRLFYNRFRGGYC
jgi:hypothetical protein